MTKSHNCPSRIKRVHPLPDIHFLDDLYIEPMAALLLDYNPPLCDRCGQPLQIFHADEGTSGYFCPACDTPQEETDADRV